MNINIIKLYINKIKKEDIDKFLKTNNIFLNKKELDYLYNNKNKYELVINEDLDTLNDIKDNISSSNYNKLLLLFNKFKNIYK